MNNPKAATAATGLHTAASRGLGFLTRGSNYNKSSAAATPKEDEEPSSKSQQLRLEEDDAATSATTDDDATNNILNVFKKKNPPPTTNNNERRTIIPEESGSPSSSIPTTTATNTTTAAGASDLLRHCQQRHDRLVALERERRATVGRDIVAHGARYTALRQLVAVQAVHETQAAGRWTLGIALAQTQLAQTLTTLNDQQAAVIERELRDDLYRDTTEVVARVTGQDSLPEKEKIRTTPVGVYPENDNDDDVDSETGILMGSNPGGAPAAAEVEAPSTAMSNNTAKENQPPVFSICFPNPNASSGGEETFAILHKQHVLLSEALSRSTVSDAAMDKMQVIQELCVEHASKLEEVAGGIAAELQAQETEIRKLWGTSDGPCFDSQWNFQMGERPWECRSLACLLRSQQNDSLVFFLALTHVSLSCFCRFVQGCSRRCSRSDTKKVGNCLVEQKQSQRVGGCYRGGCLGCGTGVSKRSLPTIIQLG